MSRRRLLAVAGAGGLMLLSTARAQAATCSVSTQSVNFGAYDPFATLPRDGVGNLAVDCDSAANYTVALDAGTNAGSPIARSMTGPGAPLAYNLYTDYNRTAVWGDGSGATSTVPGSGVRSNFTVYGRIPARQNVPAGTYTDGIVITISY